MKPRSRANWLAAATLLGCFGLACATAKSPAGGALPLERTHWTLAGLGPSAAPVAKTQTEPFLAFGEPPDRVSGSGGCNRLGGVYQQSGDKLSFGPLAGTRMACAEGEEVEFALYDAMERTAAFRIAGDRLELLDSGGAVLAVFRGSAASEP